MCLVLFGSLLLILLNGGETLNCPTGYNSIAVGCYKMRNGTRESWSSARDFCFKDLTSLPSNETVPNAITHLLAIEHMTEKSLLFYWMFEKGLQGQFWIDGIVSKSLWDWSNQPIKWDVFDADQRAVIGNGSNYKLVYNSNQSIQYQIADDIDQNKLYFICEYQVPCNEPNGCGSNATCYINFGEEICACKPGYTGRYCDTKLDECLSLQCQNGGTCFYGVIDSCIFFLFFLLFRCIDD